MADSDHWSVIESEPTRKLVRGPITEAEEVHTREGTVTAEPGDYIVQERDGNCYPISAEKLEEYYRWVPGADKPYPVGDGGD
jgi:hypothetical protein